MTAPFNPYLSLVGDDQQQQQSALQSSLFVANKRPDPARWAKVLQLSQQTKLPADLVDRNFDALSATALPDADTIGQQAPGLGRWLANPDNATLAKSEVDPLARVSRGVSLWGKLKGAGSDVSQAAQTGAADLASAAGQIGVAWGKIDPATAARFIATENQRAAQLRATAPQYVQQYQEGIAAKRPALDVGLALAGHADLITQGASAGLILDYLRAFLKPKGFAYSQIEGLVGSAPSLTGTLSGGAAGGALGSVVPFVGTAVGATIGAITGTFAGTAPITVGSAINEELSRRGIDITDPHALEAAFRDPSIIGAIRSRAEKAGITSALVTSLVAGIAGRLPAAAQAGGASALKMAGATAADVGLQAAGQGAATAAGQIASGEKVQASSVVESAIAALGAAVGFEGLGLARRGVFSRNPARMAEEVVSRTDDALRAHHDAQALQEIQQAVSEAPVTASVPEQLRELVTLTRGDSPEAPSAVYFQTSDWDAHFQGSDRSPAQAAAQILGDGGRAYDEAKATGAPLAIPLGEYVSKVMTTPDAPPLLEFARTEPTGMSLREAREYLQELPAALKTLIDETAPDAQAAAFEEGVRTQLENANAPAPATNASLVGSFFKTMAQRLGINVDELAKRYPIQIRRGEAGTAQPAAALEQPPIELRAAVDRYLPWDEASVAKLRQAGAPAGLIDRFNAYFDSAANDTPRPEYSGEKTWSSEVSPGSSYRSVVEDPYGRLRRARPVPIDALEPVEGVDRGHVGALVRQLREDPSRVPPIVAQYNGDGTYTVLDGHHRLAAARKAGFEAVPVVEYEPRTYEQPAFRSIEPINDRESIARYDLGNGDEAVVQYAVDNGDLRIGFIGSTGGEGSVGPSVRRIARDLADRTGAETVSGNRISGAKPGREAITNVEYLQPGEAQPRGRIRLSTGEGAVIELLANADRSTFLHETGHFYLDVLDTEGAKEGSALAADRQTIRDWLGAEGNVGLSREQHEQFARGFEAYLMEGKAPTERLRAAFARFRTWLTNLYRTVTNLNVQLTPDVRRVFDRMLASEAEIARVEQMPLFENANESGMTEAQASKYQAAIDASREAATSELTARMMKQLRTEETTEWRRLREPIVEEVTRQVDQDPAYIARALLQKGAKPDGSPLDAGSVAFKLHRDAVRATYGEDVWKALPKGITAPDGINPNLAAEAFGFPNGRALIDALMGTTTREARINELADYTMQLRHGERMTEGELHAMATAAVSNEQQSQLLRAEMEYLVSEHFAAFKGIARDLTKRVPPTEAIRRQAETLIGNKPIREIRPDLFEAAVNKAAREASDAFHAGKFDEAFDAKNRQLLATEVLRAARNAREAVDAAVERFKPIFGKDERLSQSRDMDLVNAARAILASYGVGRTDLAPAEYLEPVRRYDPEQYDVIRAIVDQATTGRARGDFRGLSYNDFLDVKDAVDGLWNQSRRNRQIEIDGRKMDRAEAELALREGAELRGLPDRQEGVTRAVSEWDKAKRMLMATRAWLRRAEHWVDAMDGGDPTGPYRKYLFTPVVDGITKYRTAKRETLTKYLEIAKGVEDRVTPEDIPAPELNYTFGGKAELLGALLHTGNESNLRKLLLGRHWGTLREDGTVDSTPWQAFVQRMQREGVLSKAEYDYVQGVWDLLEGLKADTQRAHHDMYGRYFDEITAQPFQALGENYKGGYFPARADPILVADQAIKREAESFLTVDNAFMFPTTGKGFTKARVEYNRPLLLNVGQVMSAIDGALRFTYIEPRVRDVARIVMSREFRPTLDRLDPTIAGEMLVPWLQRAATQTSQIPGRFKALDRFYTGLRRRAGTQTLAFHVVNALQNAANLPAALLKVPPQRMAGALWRYVRQPREMTAEIRELSPYMATRMNQATAEVLGQIDDLLMNPSKFEQARDYATKHANILTEATQSMIDVVTWGGAFDHAIEQGHASDEAVRIADSAVRETQGSGAPEDMARFEAQTPFVRLFTMFSGYFNMNANLNATEFANAIERQGLRKGAGRALYVHTLGFMLPALIAEGISRAAMGRPLDEDDDGPIDDLLGFFFGAQFATAARMIPVIGPVAEFSIRQFTQRPEDRINPSSAITTIENAAKAPKDVYDGLHDKLTTKGIKDVLTALGLASNLPLAPLAKPIGYLHDLSTGRAKGKDPLDILRGLTTGYAGATP